MISAGRVLLMPKGDYDPTATYEMLDIVSYNGSSYIAKSTTTGNLPTNTTYWQLSAYGGQAANLAGNFAPLETTEYATRAYVADDIFVDKESRLVIATTTINIGDEIEIDSNCDLTTMAELLDTIENRYDALDQRNRKLVGINPITIQTDLHLLAPGEYFKKLTNFYVTNAPTGINQVPTAIFRLTVESGLDESGSSLLLTLRTIEGEIYTQAYDGSVWSDWKKTGDIADVPTYTGATSITSGVKGLVPAAAAAEKDNYLKGDGTWGALGTAAAKNATDTITSGSTDLVESGAVYSGLALKADSEKAYQTDDTTETTLASDDIIPFYDTSATAKRKMTVQKFGEQLISNPNLLDNPWFTVNQRGATSLSAYGYGVDRWEGIYTVNASGNGLDFVNTNYIIQPLEQSVKDFLHNKTVTLSIMLSDGTIYKGTNVYKKDADVLFISSEQGGGKLNAASFSGINYAISVTALDNTTIRAIKLELGSVSTLAMDTEPNYATELLKCQRYFYRCKFPTANTNIAACFAKANNAALGVFELPVPMRATPTFAMSDYTKFTLMYTSGLALTADPAITDDEQHRHISFDITRASLTAGRYYMLQNTAVDEYMDFSADL